MTKLKNGSVWVCDLLLLFDANCHYRLTDLHFSKLIMMALTFRDVSKFLSVNIVIQTIKLEMEGKFEIKYNSPDINHPNTVHMSIR